MGLPVNQSRYLQDLLDLESEPHYVQMGFNAALTLAHQSNYAIGNVTCPVNRAFWVETIEFSSASHNVSVQVQFDAATAGGNPGLVRAHIPKNGTVVVPVRQLVRQASMLAGGNAGSVAIRAVRNDDGTASTADISAMSLVVNVHGRLIYDDIDVDAGKLIFGIGDSIFNGVGATTKNACWMWGVKKFYEGKGIRSRVSLKSKSGSTSGDHKNWLDLGLYDSAPKPDLFVYELMANDAAQSIPTATYLANMQKAVNWARARWPAAKILVVGCHGLENDPFEANAVAMRAAADGWVSGLGDAQVKYVSLATAFDRKVAANFASTDTAGQRVHPSDAGRAAIISLLTSWLNNNMPSI